MYSWKKGASYSCSILEHFEIELFTAKSVAQMQMDLND